jgi:hypothetical protein
MKGQFKVEYIYEQDEKAVEDVFMYIFDEIQKLINSKQLEEKGITTNINKHEYA